LTKAFPDLVIKEGFGDMLLQTGGEKKKSSVKLTEKSKGGGGVPKMIHRLNEERQGILFLKVTSKIPALSIIADDASN